MTAQSRCTDTLCIMLSVDASLWRRLLTRPDGMPNEYVMGRHFNPSSWSTQTSDSLIISNDADFKYAAISTRTF